MHWTFFHVLGLQYFFFNFKKGDSIVNLENVHCKNIEIPIQNLLLLLLLHLGRGCQYEFIYGQHKNSTPLT